MATDRGTARRGIGGGSRRGLSRGASVALAVATVVVQASPVIAGDGVARRSAGGRGRLCHGRVDGVVRLAVAWSHHHGAGAGGDRLYRRVPPLFHRGVRRLGRHSVRLPGGGT